jgi:hypothetical protein
VPSEPILKDSWKEMRLNLAQPPHQHRMMQFLHKQDPILKDSWKEMRLNLAQPPHQHRMMQFLHKQDLILNIIIDHRLLSWQL